MVSKKGSSFIYYILLPFFVLAIFNIDNKEREMLTIKAGFH